MAVDTKHSFARGDVVSRKYEIENHLGGGIFGNTFLARHIASGKHLAIKFLADEVIDRQGAADRLQDIFSRVKGVKHPGLIRLGEINEHGDVKYITLEYFKSQSLRQLVDEYNASGQAFTLQEACQIIIQILQALAVAHDNGFVHRMLKPENVLVQTTRSGPGGSKLVRKIKLTGLGMADLLDPSELVDRYEDTNDNRYLAPEMSGFGAAGTAQADIYSVGVILYELLCGQTPRGTFLSPTQLRDDLPEHVDNLVEIALSHNPEDRYPSATDMVRDIQRSFQLEMQAGGSQTSFRNILLGIGLTVGVLVAVGGWYMVSDKPDPLEEAWKIDQQIRKDVEAQNPLPTEAEVRAMLQLNPDMVYVPGGTYIKGRLNQEDPAIASTSEPLTEVVEVPAFFIDRFEYPNRQDQEPVGRIGWADAEEACQEAGKRLCSEHEWEKACKGPGNLVYTYGDTWDPSFCGASADEPYTVGSRRDCVSGYGVYGMSGGLREWTASSPPNKDHRKVVKGGLRGNAERGTRCAFSVDVDKEFSESILGFRCCKDVDAQPGSPPADGGGE